MRGAPLFAASLLACTALLILHANSVLRDQTQALLHDATPLRTRTTHAHDDGATQQRVAVCIAGAARTFRHKPTHETILKNIITPLREHHAVDIFFLVGLDDAVALSKPVATSDTAATLAALKRFAPAHVRILGEDDALPASRIVKSNDPRTFDAYRAPSTCTNVARNETCRVPDALFRSRQCLLAIRAQERKQAFTYDWVYRTRPDVIFFDRTLLPSQLRTDTLYTNQGRPNVTRHAGLWWRKKHLSFRAGNGAVADQVAISSRRVAEVALRAFEATEDCELYEIPGTVGPEEILRFWLMKNRVPYASVPWDWAIIREAIGPECQRLFWQRGEGTDWRRSMHRCIAWAKRYRSLFPKPTMRKYLAKLRRGRTPRDLMTW